MPDAQPQTSYEHGQLICQCKTYMQVVATKDIPGGVDVRWRCPECRRTATMVVNEYNGAIWRSL